MAKTPPSPSYSHPSKEDGHVTQQLKQSVLTPGQRDTQRGTKGGGSSREQ